MHSVIRTHWHLFIDGAGASLRHRLLSTPSNVQPSAPALTAPDRKTNGPE
jgi:hypothetical protein